jgi:ariadne-1
MESDEDFMSVGSSPDDFMDQGSDDESLGDGAFFVVVL